MSCPGSQSWLESGVGTGDMLPTLDSAAGSGGKGVRSKGATPLIQPSWDQGNLLVWEHGLLTPVLGTGSDSETQRGE